MCISVIVYLVLNWRLPLQVVKDLQCWLLTLCFCCKSVLIELLSHMAPFPDLTVPCLCALFQSLGKRWDYHGCPCSRVGCLLSHSQCWGQSSKALGAHISMQRVCVCLKRLMHPGSLLLLLEPLRLPLCVHSHNLLF